MFWKISLRTFSAEAYCFLSGKPFTNKEYEGAGSSVFYRVLTNQINARALIEQSAMVYCAGKPTEKSRVF